MALEFFTTFRFKDTVNNLSEDCITFRLCNHQWRMNLTEWSVRLGLYSADQADQGEWLEREIRPPNGNSGFDPQEVWKAITHRDAPQFKPTQSRGIHIIDLILRLAQVFLGYNVLGQENTSSSITNVELYFMWCKKKQRKVHLGYWLAFSCHSITTKPMRHLNICHILGVFMRNNPKVEIVRGCNEPMCPDLELFDIKFLKNVKILQSYRGKMCFYEPGQTDMPMVLATRATAREEGEQGERDEQGKEGERATPTEVAPAADWRQMI